MDAIDEALLRTGAPPDRVAGYYGPVGRFVRDVASSSARRPAIVGLNGPQGSGKSSLTAAVTRALSSLGLPALGISIDDFYLTHAEQRALAATHPGNRALEHRGNPGTHDVALGASVLRSLRAGGPTEVPRYDKSAHGGRGDRAPETTRVEGPLAVVILEGWMLGFRGVPAATLDAELRPVNAVLPAYDAWNAELDAFVRLSPPSLEAIVGWRIDAERVRRERGEPALSDEAARDYVERFLPTYRAYLPGLANDPPARPVLAIDLDERRAAVRVS